jgi:hypothetical protein
MQRARKGKILRCWGVYRKEVIYREIGKLQECKKTGMGKRLFLKTC